MQKEILGTIYTQVSDDFQRGIYPIARTIKAETHDLAVVYAVRGADMYKIPCQLDKSDFQSLDDAGIKNFDTGIAGTITARYCRGIGANGDNMVIEKEVKQIGNLFDENDFENPQRGRIYDTDGMCPTVQTYQGGNLEPKIIVAMRGRNPDNPSERTIGIPTEQRLEPNSQGICNTLTSVQKDNLLLENVCINDRGFSDKEPQVSIGTVPTLRAETHGNLPKVIENQYRIRKLTPLECWRLMGFSDEDFLSAKLGNRKSAKETLEKYPHLGKRVFTEVQRIEKMSNSQLYKQAGNSIVKNVLMAIFGQMISGKENDYKNLRKESEEANHE